MIRKFIFNLICAAVSCWCCTIASTELMQICWWVSAIIWSSKTGIEFAHIVTNIEKGKKTQF